MPEHVESGVCACWGCVEEGEVRSRAVASLRLLCEDRVRVDLVAYGEVPPVEVSLIEQLRGAAYERGAEGGGGRSRRGSGLPLDLIAVEMFSTLQTELYRDAVSVGAVAEVAGVDPVVSARGLLAVVDSLDAVWLGERVAGWEAWGLRIRGYLVPARRTPVPGVCPAAGCGADVWFTYDEDGEQIRESALRAVWVDGRVDGVECACCFSRWGCAELLELADELNPGRLLQIGVGKA